MKPIKRIKFPMFSMLLILFGLVLCRNLAANEFSPVGIWTDAEVIVEADNSLQLKNMIDGDRETLSSILDTSRTGTKADTQPPYGDFPITAKIVLDLGEEREISGVRFYTPPVWKALGIRNLSAFTCHDAEGKENVEWLCENVDIFPMNYGLSVVSSWPTVRTRYLGIVVNNAWQIRDPRQGLASDKIFNVVLAEITCLTEPPLDPVVKNPPEQAFPEGRLEQDWLLQDYGPNTKACFTSTTGNEVEQAILNRVLTELSNEDSAAEYRERMQGLIDSSVPGSNERWRNLYRDCCRARRAIRLGESLDEELQIIYVKHHVFGSTDGLGTSIRVTDSQYHGATPEERMGSQLCRLTLAPDGTVRHEVLLEKPEGIIRNPNLSYDATSLVFSMRESLADDYHLYTMALATGQLKQITFTPEKDGKPQPCAEIEPCYTPNGDLLFVSTRNVSINDCWPDQNAMIYTSKGDGSHIRRLTYDELDVGYPQILEDGRVLYTRWEYNDRTAYYLHPLFTMNTDGTMQTEYAGNNSLFPASYIQARGIPDSNKIIAIISGHHVPNKGKLALVDRTLGTQDGVGIEFVAGSSPDGTPGRKKSWLANPNFHDFEVDLFGQTGPQFQTPFALDEEHYIVAYCPEGWASQSGPYNPPFGIYWMTADGRRELLAFDWWINCTEPVAVVERPIPAQKPSQYQSKEKYGTFILQDVYYGPGLTEVPRGTAKKIRVVALEYRAAWIGTGANAGESDLGYVQTPVSLNNANWDVKHVLGEADIEEDGSAAFLVPARVPVYFQILDEKGYCIQTMRSWSTLQPGETFACIGCHEDKQATAEMIQSRPAPLALKKAPQPLAPFAGIKHPLMERLEREESLDSIENYAGMNAPVWTDDSEAPTAGFSYPQLIQPIWDRHCITCHSPEGTGNDGKNAAPDLTGKKVTLDLHDPLVLNPVYLSNMEDNSYDGTRTPLCIDWMRDFTQSYVTLTNYGKLAGSQWIQWLETRSRPQMLPPYHTGSSKSPLMNYLEPEHYKVNVSENEKRLVACWIDLLIPFCGSYLEANRWSDVDKETYRYYLEKRRFFIQEELNNIRVYDTALTREEIFGHKTDNKSVTTDSEIR